MTTIPEHKEEEKSLQQPVAVLKPNLKDFKPSNIQIMLRDWISNFHEEFMMPAESELSDLQRELF